jgi:hypothetical protein
MALRMHFGAARLHQLTLARMREAGDMPEAPKTRVQMDLFDAVSG